MDETDDARRARQKLSKKQYETHDELDENARIWAARDPASVTILFTWTGRVSVRKAWFHVYGEVGEGQAIPMPLSFIGKIGELLRRVLRWYHPHHANEPGDEAVVKLIDMSIPDETTLNASNASSFFSFVEQEGYFGRLAVKSLLQEAFEAWQLKHPQQQQQQKKKDRSRSVTPMPSEVRHEEGPLPPPIVLPDLGGLPPRMTQANEPTHPPPPAPLVSPAREGLPAWMVPPTQPPLPLPLPPPPLPHPLTTMPHAFNGAAPPQAMVMRPPTTRRRRHTDNARLANGTF